MAETFGWQAIELLLAAMKAKGLQQKEVAKRMGVTNSQLSRCLQETRNPTLRTVQRIADAVGVRLSVALDWTTMVDAEPRTASDSPYVYGGRNFRGVTVDGVVIGSADYVAMSDRDRAQLVLTAEARRRQAADDARWEAYWADVWQGHYETYKLEQLAAEMPVLQPRDWNAEKRVENQHREAYRRKHGWADGDPNDPALTDPRNLDSTFTTAANTGGR